jgi:hypothetical protein
MAASRYLTPTEIALFPDDFTRQFECARVRLINRPHNPLARGKILVRGYDIYWANYPEDFTRCALPLQALLVHELCHVWQYATGRLSAFRYLTRPRNWVYGYDIRRGAFDAHPIEQQADLLQDWFTVNAGGPPSRYAKQTPHPSREEINAVVPFAP